MRPHEHHKTIILADLGILRIFRISPTGDPLAPHEGPLAIEELSLPKNDQNADQPGRFPVGGDTRNTVTMAQGEDHREESEYEKRRIQFIAEEIERIVDEESPTEWCLAAPATINQRILDQVDPELRQFLTTNLKADLTHITKRELEERFLKQTPA